MLIIGSVALQHHLPALLDRRPRDIDVICTWEEFEERSKNAPIKYPVSENKWILKYPDEIWECEIAWSDSTGRELLDRHNGDSEYATPEELLALKLSHRYLKNSPHFSKTRRDIQTLRFAGFQLDEWLTDWVKRREIETYDYNHPRLDRNKKDFFSDDGIDYVYDHDSLHKAVAIHDRPAYTYFQVEGQEVLCDMNKFATLPIEIRLAAVWEESAVLALERSYVPFNADPDKAFETALKKVCTSITSGKFREFAWEHYSAVLELNKQHNYVSMFENGLSNGTVVRNGDD